eukprot:5513245-Ditylum_brightwellii.AAC.1
MGSSSSGSQQQHLPPTQLPRNMQSFQNNFASESLNEVRHVLKEEGTKSGQITRNCFDITRAKNRRSTI